MNRTALFAGTALALLCAPSLRAWGCDGHQVVAILAENLLSAKAAQKANALLAAHPGPTVPRRFCDTTGFSPMVDASTWADDFRETDPSTGPLHFIDIPIAERKPPTVEAYCRQGCVVDAIRSNLQKLKTAPNDDDRAMALRLLIHFVGDVHQPLHSSTNNDHGGNCVPVSYFSSKTSLHGAHDDATPNLHAVWDTSLIHTFMRRNDYAVEDLAGHLQHQYAQRLKRWGAMQDPAAWALDSFERSRTIAYGSLPVFLRAEPPVEVKSCADDNHVAQRMLALNEQIDDIYLDSAIPVVKVQLAKAGARLARMLEDALQ